MEHLVTRRMIEPEPQNRTYCIDHETEIIAPAPSLICVELKAPGHNWNEDRERHGGHEHKRIERPTVPCSDQLAQNQIEGYLDSTGNPKDYSTSDDEAY